MFKTCVIIPSHISYDNLMMLLHTFKATASLDDETLDIIKKDVINGKSLRLHFTDGYHLQS